MELSEYIISKFGSSDINEIRRMKLETEKFSKSLTEVVEVKAYDEKEVRELCKAVGIEYLEGYETRVVTFTISTEDVDRDSDIVRQAGIDKDDYMKNPVIMFAHNSKSLPIGSTLKIWRSNNSTKALALIYDDRVDSTGLSDTIFRMVKAGALRGASIGFSSKEARYPTDDEIKQYKMNPYGVIYEKVSMHEWSVCSIPANQNSLRTSKAFEEKHFDIAKEFGLIEKENISDKDDNLNKVMKRLSDIDESIKSLKEQVTEISKAISEGLILKGLTPNKEEEDVKEYDDLLDKISDVIKTLK